MTRLAVVVSHPIQYHTPLFRLLAKSVELEVFYGQTLTPDQQAQAGFGVPFDWDIDLLSGYHSTFLKNISSKPGPSHFHGCDTPDVGAHLKDGAFDALLVFGWYLKCLVQATWAAKRIGLPVMVRGDSQLDTPRGILARSAKAVVYPALLRSFDAALYVGERSRTYLKHYRYPDSRQFFSPHCVDTAWFASRATPENGRALRARLGIGVDEQAVLFAGKLVPFKRPLDVVEACALARLREGHLIVAGAGELEETVRARAENVGLKIHLLGFQNQTQMPAAYAAANVLVLPSTGRETWGLVANEALACGTPIIVSDAAGCAPDLATNDVGGTFPLGDLAALGDAIRETLQSPPSREAIEAKSNAFSLAAACSGIAAALAAVAGGAMSEQPEVKTSREGALDTQEVQ